MTYIGTIDQLLLAAKLATRRHEGQKRKDGTAYISHPMRVSIRAREAAGTYGEIAALLHDLVEDTDTTLTELREMGFNPLVVEAVDHLTRRKGESYSDFITRCNKHGVARLVKIADIEDNLDDQSALEPEEAEFLKNRYEKALLTLKGD